MHAPDDYHIRAITPDGLERSGAPDRILRVQTPEGAVAWLEISGRALEGGDAIDAVVACADLLREGWMELAEPVHPPVLRDGLLYRGFTLERISTLLGSGGETLRLRLLLPARLETSFNWHRATDALNAFHRAFLPVTPHA